MNFDFFAAPNPPTEFDPHHRLSGFESVSVAGDRQDDLADILIGGDANAKKLADLIGGCDKGKRCRSGACPICLRRWRRWFAGTVAGLIAEDDVNWWVASLVPPDLVFPIGKLDQFEPAKFKDRLRKQLQRSKISDATAIGGIDLAVQHFDDGRGEVWHPHAYLLIRKRGKKAIHRALTRFYPSTDDTPRPLRVKKIDKTDLLKPTTYAFKSTFKQRIPCKDANGNKDTEEKGLAPKHWLELAPLLHKWGIDGRLIRRNLDGRFAQLNVR
jgi:hypothetical protein